MINLLMFFPNSTTPGTPVLGGNAVLSTDYTTLADAVATGKHVYIPPATTHTLTAVINLAINQIVVGADRFTSKIIVSGNHRGLLLQNGSGVHNLSLQGSGISSGNAFNVGLGTTDTDWAITNCIFTGFAGTDNAGSGGGGIQCIGGVGDYKRGALIENCLFDGNVTGINVMAQAEFMTITNCFFFNNGTALVNRGGNNRLCSLNMVGNTLAYSMQAGYNSGHGSMTNCTINHNVTNLKITDQAIGFAFTGCHFYDGHIEITNSTDITFGNCHIPGTGPTPNNMTLSGNSLNGVRIDSLSKYVPSGYNKILTGNDLVIV